jgi:hypothetical protein
MCDLRSSKPIACTNGTLFSTRDIECATIQIGNPQSVLNCAFKDEDIDVRFQEASTIRTSTISDQTTTRAPLTKPTRKASTSVKPLIDSDDQETLETINRVDSQNFLVHQVKSAMQTVFPHDLFVKPTNKLLPPKDYLPPYESQASRDLVTSMRGVFPMELLVVSKLNNGISTTSSLETRLSENKNIQQNTQTTNKNVDSDIGFKTQLSGIDTRFGGNIGSTQKPLYQQQDFRDRLIFSN